MSAIFAVAASQGDVSAIFLQYGALGVFALVSLGFFRTVYKRETERADRAENALAELNKDVREKVVPALTEANRTVAEMANLLRDSRVRP